MKAKSILFSLALVCLSLSVSAQNYANPTLKSIHERTSVRAYSSKPVSKETLMELVKAGMAAPTAMNKQPWEFIIIQDRAILDKLGTAKPPVKKAQAAIVVAGDSKLSSSWMLDCSAATENILIAATSMGLGTVWTGVYGNAKMERLVTDQLSLPDGVMPLNIIAIGYPEGTPKAKNKFVKEKVHFNKY